MEFFLLFQPSEIWDVVLQRPGCAAARDDLEGGIGHANPHAFLERWLEVANRLQLLAARGCTPAGVEANRRTNLGQMLSGQHAGTDRLVDALALGKVQATAGVNDDHWTRHLKSGN